MSNVRTQIGKVIGKSLNGYHSRVKPKIDELKFKEQYQGRIIDCMVGEVDDNYIETPLTDENVVKLEHSKEGVIKIPQIKGKTILVDADGNETDTPAEGCRLVSVGEEEDNKLIILSKNKNLITYPFEETSVTRYGITFTDNKDGTITLNGTSTHPNVFNYLLRVSNKWNLPNGTYSFSTCSSNDSAYFVLGGSNSDVVYTAGTKGTFVVNGNLGNCGHCLIQIKKDASFNNVTIKPIIVSGSTIPTDYIPHKHHKTEILLNEPLRKINNDIYDEIKEKEVIYRVGHTIFNGEEHWYTTESYGLQNAEGYISFYSNKLYNKTPNSKGYKCNLFNYKGYDSGFRQTLDFEGISDGGGYYMTFVRIKKERLETNDVEGFKNYLKNNPMKVLYVYKEPIIEELPNGITLQGFDDTTMYIENSITPTVSYGYNALIPYKEELRTQKEEVETNTLDIENNIIPYLMDMEYNLMLMEDN